MKTQESVNMGGFGLFVSRTKTCSWIFVSSMLLLLFLEAAAVHRDRYIPPSMYNRQTQRGTWRSRQSQYPQQISSQRLQRFQQMAGQRRNVNGMPPFRNTQRSIQQRSQARRRGSRPMIEQVPPYANRAQSSLSRQNAVQYSMDNVRYPADWRNRQRRLQINNLDNNSIKVLDNNPVQNRQQGPIVYNPTVRASSAKAVNRATNPSPRVAVRPQVLKGKTDRRNPGKSLPANDKPLVLSKASLSESLKSQSDVPKPAIKTIPITVTGNSKNGSVMSSDISGPIGEPSVVIPSAITPVKLQTKTNFSAAESVRTNRNVAKKPVLLLVRKQDGTVSNTLYKLRRTGSEGNNKPAVPLLSPIVANIPKILSSLSKIQRNGTPVVRVIRTGSMLNNSSTSTAGNFLLNRLLPPRVSPGVQSIGKVKTELPNAVNMPLLNSVLSNMNLQNRNAQALGSLNSHLPAMGSMNTANLQAVLSAMSGRLPGGGMRSMTPFAQQPMSLVSMAGNWDGGSANVPLVFQRMGITHGSQLSPSMQERLFGDTIDPPDPTPTAGSSGTTQTATGAEVEAEDFPSSPKPSSKRMQKKLPNGKRRRVHQRRKTKEGKIVKITTTLATTPTLNNTPSASTPAPKDIAVSLAKKLISLVSKGDPTANGILKSLNIDVPAIGAKPTSKNSPRKSNEQNNDTVSKFVNKTTNNVDKLVGKSVTLLDLPQKKKQVKDPSQTITNVPADIEKPKSPIELTLPAQPIAEPKKALDTGEKISLSSFLSSNDLGGLKIERIVPELPQPSDIKPLMETPTPPRIPLQSLPVQNSIVKKAKHIIPPPITTIAPHTSEVTTVLPTKSSGSHKSLPAVQIPSVKPNVDILFMPKVLPIDGLISSTSLATKTPSAIPIGKQSGKIGGVTVGSGDKNESSVDVLLNLLSQLNSANNSATSLTLANKKITVKPNSLSSTTQPPTSPQTTAQTSLPPTTKSTVLPQTQGCLPSSPGFQCRGIDFFATLESMGKWCVDTCRRKGCVNSVCECNCNGMTRPAFRNDNWQQSRRHQNNQNGRRWNGQRNGRFRGRGWQQGRRRWQRPTTTTEEPPEIEDDEVVETTTEVMTTTTAYDFTFGFYSGESFQTTPMTSFDENARPPPNWRGTQWELPPAPIRPKNQKENEDKPTQNPNSWNQEANGWSGGSWEQRSNDRWNQPTRNRWNNQRRFRGGSRDTWREPIGNTRGRQRGSWQNSQRSGDHWRRDMVGNRRSQDSGFRLRNTWRASKNGGEEQEGQEQ